MHLPRQPLVSILLVAAMAFASLQAITHHHRVDHRCGCHSHSASDGPARAHGNSTSCSIGHILDTCCGDSSAKQASPPCCQIDAGNSHLEAMGSGGSKTELSVDHSDSHHDCLICQLLASFQSETADWFTLEIETKVHTSPVSVSHWVARSTSTKFLIRGPPRFS